MGISDCNPRPDWITAPDRRISESIPGLPMTKRSSGLEDDEGNSGGTKKPRQCYPLKSRQGLDRKMGDQRRSREHNVNKSTGKTTFI